MQTGLATQVSSIQHSSGIVRYEQTDGIDPALAAGLELSALIVCQLL